jgi:hypothetical protein
MTVAPHPIDLVRSRLHVVSGQHHAFRARCPAHGSRGGTLAVREGAGGAVLLKCHAGCTAEAVMHALQLELRDLFPNTDTWRQRQAEIATERQRFRRTPRATVRVAIERELKRTRDKILAELGYARPLRSADINVVRARVAAIYGVKLAPIAAFAWQGAPHDDDPAWPALFERRLREVLIESSVDPDRKHSPDEWFEAASRAAGDLRELARHRGIA